MLELERRVRSTPMPLSLDVALLYLVRVSLKTKDGVVSIDVPRLLDIVDAARENMEIRLRAEGLSSYSVDKALAIYVYTLPDPAVFFVINRLLSAPDRMTAKGISLGLRACLPYIKFLDVALASLPESFRYQGEAFRGVKWVFPSPDEHNVGGYFCEGRKLRFFEFRSSSKDNRVMMDDNFCGREGPRTIFAIKAIHGLDIKFFSAVPTESEARHPPLPMCVVLGLTCAFLSPP